MAKLYFRYGAMGSSKSANILMVRYNYEERGQYAVLLKPRTDNRDGEHEIKSRIGLEAPAEYVDEFLKEISDACRRKRSRTVCARPPVDLVFLHGSELPVPLAAQQLQRHPQYETASGFPDEDFQCLPGILDPAGADDSACRVLVCVFLHHPFPVHDDGKREKYSVWLGTRKK